MNAIWKIKLELERLINSNSLQEYINSKYKDKNTVIISTHGACKQVITKDGLKFNINNMINSIDDVDRDYDISDMKTTDIVLDIGGNIGAFALKAAELSRYVYVVEPLFHKEIEKNIRKNKIENICVLNYALGGNEVELIRYGDKTSIINSLNLSDIRKICSWHVDYLKLDCEGAEFSIRPEELKGIRTIVGEIHCHKRDLCKFEEILKCAGYFYKIKSDNSKHLHTFKAKRYDL